MSATILFVDDEPDFERLIRQKYRRKIRAREFVPEFALNGLEALAKLKERGEAIDLVITDIKMPEMDGLTLVSEIQKLRQSLLVVIVSAFGDMENIRSAMNRGAFDFLTKPIDFDDLEITRRKALGAVAKNRERRRLVREKSELEERNHFIENIFGRYLSEAVVKTLLDSPEGLDLGGERRDLTVLTADLRGFSSLAERLAPEEIIASLNHYFSVMIDIIGGHGGTINELIGDGMLVFFGAPLKQADHALRAAKCAVDMQVAMDSVNRHNLENGWPEMKMGIGVNSGEVIVGNIGSHKRAKYGVVGTHVNLAFRIESRAHGGDALISENTFERCADLLDTDGGASFNPKGFEDPVKIYNLFGVRGDSSRMLSEREYVLSNLAEPIAVEYSVVRGESSDQGIFSGRLTKIGSDIAELEVDLSSSLLHELKVKIFDAEERRIFPSIYARVVRGHDDGKRLLLTFSSTPPEVEEYFQRLRRSSGGSTS